MSFIKKNIYTKFYWVKKGIMIKYKLIAILTIF